MDAIFSLGQWIKRRRKAHDLTQDALAQRVGCSLETIRKIEADARRPSRQIAERLADQLGLAPDERLAFMQAARAELAPDQLASPTRTVPQPALAQPDALPSGTVTFLFTDIEGSTRLWERHPQAMGAAVARHEAILRESIASAGGVIFKTVGDAVYAAFASALGAVRAALNGQRALSAEPWGATGPLRVRMALHTGVVEARAGDYVGLPLSRIARLLAVGHGGQILLSLASAELVREQLPPDAVLRDLGMHRLKDLSRPEQIFQLSDPNLSAAFPPLQTLDARRHNLPAQPTALIGREREIAEVAALLRRTDVRLVTLAGPGGAGKTRLALQVAAELIDDIANGVYFVDLAPIRDPALVASTIAETLGLKETGSQPLVQQLRAYLHNKTVLLLLDNFEQVLDAALLVAELLSSAPALKVLVTSREVLHLSGEHEFVVPPLGLPPQEPRTGTRRLNRESNLSQQAPVLGSRFSVLSGVEELTQYEAVRLFIARARAAKSNFAVTNASAPAIAEICAQVDGLPLAIELAAARIKLFSPEALLARLGQRLPFLTGGPRDLPLRQQTLRNTIDWSYNLLDAAEQALFRRLGVFVGGCTLEAAEVVCNADGDPSTSPSAYSAGSGSPSEQALPLDVASGSAALIDKSLLRQEEGADGAPRLVMLETIREYALERLAASGELEMLRQRHAAFFVSLTEAGLPYERQELEHPNFRAALLWSRTEADGTTGLRLVVALDWQHSVSEARLWLTAALAPRAGGASWPDTADSRSLRAKALDRLGNTASWQNDLAAAQPALEESLALFRELGDTWSIADTASSLGRVVAWQGDYERSGALLEESLTLFRQLEDAKGIFECFFFRGNLAYAQGNLRQASERWQEALSVARQLENTWMMGVSLLHLGMVALDQGDDEGAGAHLAESLVLFRELGEQWMTLHALEVCAGLAAARGGDRRADAEGAGRRAARLFGADEALRETLGLGILTIWRDHYQRGVAAAHALLDDATFASAWGEGRAMTLEQAIAYALSEGD